MNLNSRLCEKLGMSLDSEGYYPHVFTMRVYGHDGTGFDLTGVVPEANAERVWMVDGEIVSVDVVFGMVPDSPLTRGLAMCKAW